MRLTIHETLFLLVSFLMISPLRAANISTIIAGNNALTQLALDVDEPLVALTIQSGFAAAQAITRHFRILNDQIASAVFFYNRTVTPTTFDPATEDSVTESYGELANTIEELMFDLSDQEKLMRLYFQQRAIYRTLLHMNTTFGAYGTFMHSVVGDIYHRNITRNETANAAFGIVNATAKYGQRPPSFRFA
ncbi:hypothetical protein ACLMJK_008959 [Lecanora helva]